MFLLNNGQEHHTVVLFSNCQKQNTLLYSVISGIACHSLLSIVSTVKANMLYFYCQGGIRLLSFFCVIEFLNERKEKSIVLLSLISRHSPAWVVYNHTGRH